MPGSASPMLLYLVKQVELASRAKLDDIFRPIGMTALQYTALTVLERHDNMSSAQLARRSFVTAQSMADMIGALEARGLIERTRDDSDRRRLVVALTAEGRALLDRYRDTVRALEEGMLAGLTDIEVAALRHALNTCHSNLAASLPRAQQSHITTRRLHLLSLSSQQIFGSPPLAGKNATTEGCNVVSVNAIVIDPEVPDGPRCRLAEADRRRRAPGPAGHVGTYTFRQAGSRVYRREDDREYGLGVPELIPFAEPAPTLDRPAAWRLAAQAIWPRLRERYGLDNAAILYHRHYICPPRDLDAPARQSWQRATMAATRIEQSHVVRQQLIDSVRVTTVLPYHLWDIAERLARLSALRAGHREILDGVADDDPDVLVVLQPQRRAHELAAEDIERRVRDLEVFAASVTDADAARRREDAVRRLADLNDVHRELLARVGSSSDPLGSDLPEAHDVQAVIDQANKAIRAANEAGRSLALPTPFR